MNAANIVLGAIIGGGLGFIAWIVGDAEAAKLRQRRLDATKAGPEGPANAGGEAED